MNKVRGLYGKYNVTKADGTPTDPNAQYFVLRIDTDPAARAALLAYANYIAEHDWDVDFPAELIMWVAKYEQS